MIVSLILGRRDSVGFPDKNLYPILGCPMAWYPMNTSLRSKYIDKVYLSTNDERLMQIAKENNVEVIERPEHLCSSTSLSDDSYVHGYKEIINRLKEKPEFINLLFCNAVFSSPEMIDEGIEILRKNPDYDSAISVSKYNMWSPIRARKIGKDGLLHPFISFDKMDDNESLTCDRDSQGDVWFSDFGVCIVRPRCLENIEQGTLPQRWMGNKIYPLQQFGGLDVDYEWQVPQVEWWIKNMNKERSL